MRGALMSRFYVIQVYLELAFVRANTMATPPTGGDGGQVIIVKQPRAHHKNAARRRITVLESRARVAFGRIFAWTLRRVAAASHSRPVGVRSGDLWRLIGSVKRRTPSRARTEAAVNRTRRAGGR